MPGEKPLTKRQLAKEADRQLRSNARNVLEKAWACCERKLDADNLKTLELVFRTFNYDRVPGGVTIFNQHLQVNAPATETAQRVRSFDQIITKLEEQENLTRRQRLLATENSDEDEEILDGDPEDEDSDGGQGDPPVEEAPLAARPE